MSENLVEIKNAPKSYEAFRLGDVSLELQPGYIMGLIGPNGAGKTTLIKLLMGAINRDGGSIHLFGSDNQTAARKRIGFVQDEPTLYGYLTLDRMRTIIAGFYEEWDEVMFQSLIERFDLPLSKRVMALSRGMTTKFALCLALSHNADLLILDEPTTGLDPASRRELLTVLQEYIECGTRSVLFSTHITSDLERVADFITLIQSGTIKFSAPKDEIMESWALIKGDNSQLNDEVCQHLEGWQRREHGFEALTSQRKDAACLFDGEVLIEPASLEDILFYTTPRHRGQACSR